MDSDKKAQIREAVKNFTPSPNNIEGIFNYCDRWCERCRFRDRCTQYEMEVQTQTGKPASISEAIEYVGIMLEDTVEKIYDELEKRGIDISEVNNVDYQENKRDQVLEVLGREYFISVMKWLDANAESLKDKSLQMFTISEKKGQAFAESLEVINWYMSMIAVKISRALRPGLQEDDVLLQDRIATGRLVIVCIVQSIKAFVYIMECCESKEDDILSFLTTLARLRNGLFEDIPQSKEFRRPYLDFIVKT